MFFFLGVDDRVKAKKRKLGDLDCGEMMQKNHKKSNVDKSKNEEVKQKKSSRSR